MNTTRLKNRFSFATSLKTLCLAVPTFIVLALNSFAHADSSVWKVSKGGQELYIGGTVHLLQQEDHPLPEEFDKAYADASHIYFETDIQEMSTPQFQTRMMQALMLTNGETLQSSLKPETYAKLSEYISAQGGQIAQLQPFSPSGAAIMLTVMEYMKLGFRPDLGVDVTYAAKAAADKKQIGMLESVEDQLAFMADMGKGKDDEMILYTLRDIGRLSEYIGELKSAWKTGDMKKMDDVALSELKSEFPEAYESLVLTRNNNWLIKIKPMFETKEKEFILVGALHLVGSDGLLQQLAAQGYTVTQL